MDLCVTECSHTIAAVFRIATNNWVFTYINIQLSEIQKKKRSRAINFANAPLYFALQPTLECKNRQSFLHVSILLIKTLSEAQKKD